MIAHWILYCAAVGVALSLGAAALERALRACALPVRWAWLGAMLLTLAIPAAVRALPREAPLARRVAWTWARLDRPLLLAWRGGASALLHRPQAAPVGSAVVAAAVDSYNPQVGRAGAAQCLCFLLDANGQVLRTGPPEACG